MWYCKKATRAEDRGTNKLSMENGKDKEQLKLKLSKNIYRLKQTKLGNNDANNQIYKLRRRGFERRITDPNYNLQCIWGKMMSVKLSDYLALSAWASFNKANVELIPRSYHRELILTILYIFM